MVASRIRPVLPALLFAALLAPAARAGGAEDQAAVVQGGNAFAVDLYRALRDEPGNLFFSPYSISSALAMTWAGARGDTEKEMAAVLRFPVGQDRLHAAQKRLRDDLEGRRMPGRPGKDGDEAARPFELVVANSLWGQQGFGFLPEFLAVVRSGYGAGLTEVDFRGNPDGARTRINDWVLEKTRDRIPDLIPKDFRLDDCRLVLVNAIYFKAAWTDAFQEKNTKKEPFHVAPARTVTVPMMHRHGMFGQFETPVLRVAALPYVGGDLSMIVLVPKAVDGIAAVEKALNPKALDAWIAGAEFCSYDLGLPRFGFTFSTSVKKALDALGMKKAFDGREADFSGMTGQRDLCVNDVLHKAFVDVNEAGTEAAAATAVLMGPTGMQKQGKPLVVDRPFLFLIRDNRTKAVLFMGRVTDPAKE